MTEDLNGKAIGGYEIIDPVGRGGMATVYRAKQNSMNRTVAIKLLPRHFAKDTAYLQRFEREVKIVSQLEHRNIVPVYDYGEYDGQPYIVMRYMSGGSVDDLVKQGPLSIEAIKKIIEQIAPALDYAHSKNVLHRDLKPSNILLDDDGGAYITDFGIARILGVEGDGQTITTQGVVGTPSYMSPEQAQGKPLDGRSDVYSLGIMLFEMTTGRRPFLNETPYGIAVMQVTTQPPAPRSINPNISGAVEQVIIKALKKRPENRYQTAVALAESLRMAIERPESIHDTQPRGNPNQASLQVTQQSPAREYQTTLPPENQIPSVTAPPAYTYAPAPSNNNLRRMPTVRARIKERNRRSNFWLSVMIGGIIGCGLLALLTAGAMLAVDRLLNDTTETVITATPTEPPAPQVTGVGALIQTIIAATGAPEDAPTLKAPTPTISDGQPEPETAVAPIGQRGNFDPELNTGHILYFAEADGSFDIFKYSLASGENTNLSNDTETSSYHALSPDGTRLAFQSNRDGDFDIYVLNLTTSAITKLTYNDILDRLPAWSPDGEWIMYSSDSRGDGNYDLYRVRADGGSEPEVIYRDGSRNSHVRYSHDGRFIVFTSGEGGNALTWEIVRMELATGIVTVLTQNQVRDASPQFTPDDTQILFVTDGSGGAAIALMDAEKGGLAKIIYDGGGFEWGMEYSPDGAYIFFNEEEASVSSIYVMQANGTEVREIEGLSGFFPIWTAQ